MPPSCTQAGCPLSKTGQCLEGLKAVECPNYVSEGLPAPVAQVVARPKETFDLPSGTALDASGTYLVGRERIPRVVLLAGEQRSGKTTLIASLYELFQEGPVGDFYFAGSRTLPAFEERCHDARMASNREKPDTERTKPAEGLRFLHLCLRERSTDIRHQLLLADMSGELYDTLRDSADECRKYDHIGRADHLVAMLNGAKVAKGDHSDSYTHTRGLIRSLVDTGVLHAHCNVTLVTTMWDLLAGNERAQARVAELEADFRDRFGLKLPRLRTAHVAARPTNTSVAFGDGLGALVSTWISAAGLPPRPDLQTIESSREFDRFAFTQERSR